jgi:hypothetical protein
MKNIDNFYFEGIFQNFNRYANIFHKVYLIDYVVLLFVSLSKIIFKCDKYNKCDKCQNFSQLVYFMQQKLITF